MLIYARSLMKSAYVGVGALGGYSWGTKGNKSTNTDSE